MQDALANLLSFLADAACFIDKEQSLVAGLLAIVAAFIGGHFITRQIDLARFQQAEADQRRFDATRAVFPLTLSYISEYAVSCGVVLKLLLQTAQDEMIPGNVNLPALPELPRNVIEEVKAMVEAACAGDRRAIANLINDLQVQSSRLRGTRSSLMDPQGTLTVTLNLETSVIAYAAIYAHAAALFCFARRESDVVRDRITWDELRTGLNLIGFRRDDYPGIHETAKRRIDQQEQPNGHRV